MRIFALVILFAFGLVVQTTVLSSTQVFLSAFPFLLVVSVLLLHRTSFAYALAYFLASVAAVYIYPFAPGTIIAYLLGFSAAAFLMTRVFSSRSLYSLMVIGIVAYAVFYLVRLIAQQAITFPIQHIVFLFLILYIGYITSKVLQLIAGNIFFQKHV